jgi:hypothetical protein
MTEIAPALVAQPQGQDQGRFVHDPPEPPGHDSMGGGCDLSTLLRAIPITTPVLEAAMVNEDVEALLQLSGGGSGATPFLGVGCLPPPPSPLATLTPLPSPVPSAVLPSGTKRRKIAPSAPGAPAPIVGRVTAAVLAEAAKSTPKRRGRPPKALSQKEEKAPKEKKKPKAPSTTDRRRKPKGGTLREAKERKRTEKEEKRRRKQAEKEQRKRNRVRDRMRKMFLKMGMPATSADRMLESMQTFDTLQRTIRPNTIDLNLIPSGHYDCNKIPLTQPLQVPFDAISFDGRHMISVLAMTNRRECPTVTRFVYMPQSDVSCLVGDPGVSNPEEAFLYPSLGSAAKRCNLKTTDGWTYWHVLTVYNGRTYRVPLKRFRKKHGGPGFENRKGFSYTPEELDSMCECAAASHHATKGLLEHRFWNLVYSMGIHSDREVLPGFLEPFLKVIPTILDQKPQRAVEYATEWILPPPTPDFHPPFVHYA